MSGANKNCHVSTKWEDTGGRNNPECDATVLRNAESNDISLQELIEHELALRGSVTVSAAANGLVDCEQALICDTDRNKKIASDENDDDAVAFGCSTPIKSNGKLVTEVDDFDLLYDEVNTEVVANGHADAAESLENSAVETETLSASEATVNSVVFDSLENQNTSPDAVPQSPPGLCGGDGNADNADGESCIDCATDDANAQFVPVSHVNATEEVRVWETTVDATEHELFCSYERVRSATGDDDWIRVSDATAPEESDDVVANSTDVFHDDDPNAEECDRENRVDVDENSCQPAVGNESSVPSKEEQKSTCDEENVDETTNSALSCDGTETSPPAEAPQESEALSNQTGHGSTTPQCNGWRESPAEEVEENSNAGEELLGIEEILAEMSDNDCSSVDNRFEDFSTCPRITLIESAQQSIGQTTQTKLIEECSYNIAHSNVTYVSVDFALLIR